MAETYYSKQYFSFIVADKTYKPGENENFPKGCTRNFLYQFNPTDKKYYEYKPKANTIDIGVGRTGRYPCLVVRTVGDARKHHEWYYDSEKGEESNVEIPIGSVEYGEKVKSKDVPDEALITYNNELLFPYSNGLDYRITQEETHEYENVYGEGCPRVRIGNKKDGSKNSDYETGQYYYKEEKNFKAVRYVTFTSLFNTLIVPQGYYYNDIISGAFCERTNLRQNTNKSHLIYEKPLNGNLKEQEEKEIYNYLEKVYKNVDLTADRKTYLEKICGENGYKKFCRNINNQLQDELCILTWKDTSDERVNYDYAMDRINHIGFVTNTWKINKNGALKIEKQNVIYRLNSSFAADKKYGQVNLVYARDRRDTDSGVEEYKLIFGRSDAANFFGRYDGEGLLYIDKIAGQKTKLPMENFKYFPQIAFSDNDEYKEYNWDINDTRALRYYLSIATDSIEENYLKNFADFRGLLASKNGTTSDATFNDILYYSDYMYEEEYSSDDSDDRPIKIWTDKDGNTQHVGQYVALAINNNSYLYKINKEESNSHGPSELNRTHEQFEIDYTLYEKWYKYFNTKDQESEEDKKTREELLEEEGIWFTPTEYYSKTQNIESQELAMVEKAEISTKQLINYNDNKEKYGKQEYSWFWIDTFKNWVKFTMMDENNDYLYLSMWNGKGEWIPIYNITDKYSKKDCMNNFMWDLDLFPIEIFNPLKCWSRDFYLAFESSLRDKDNNIHNQTIHAYFNNNNVKTVKTTALKFLVDDSNYPMSFSYHLIKLPLDTNTISFNQNTFQNVRFPTMPKVDNRWEQGITTHYSNSIPTLTRLPSGELGIFSYFRCHGNYKMFSSDIDKSGAFNDISEVKPYTRNFINYGNIELLNKMCAEYFGKGDDKTIKDDYCNFNKKDTSEEYPSENISSEDLNVKYEKDKWSDINNLTINFKFPKPNVTTVDDNSTDYVERWD